MILGLPNLPVINFIWMCMTRHCWNKFIKSCTQGGGDWKSKSGTIKIVSTTYGSQMQPRGVWSSNILVSWVADNGQVLQDRFFLSAGIVRYYFKHSIQFGDEHLTHCFACMKWYIPHEQSTSLYGNPIRVCKQYFHPGGPSSFVPVQRIFSRFSSAELEREGQRKIVVAPINRNVQLW